MRLHLLGLCLLLSACATSGARGPAVPTAEPAAPRAEPAPPSGPFGTAHPFVFQHASPDGRWLVACQAREDTDGDGSVEVHFGYHGDSFGDALAPYLFLGPGEGQRIDDFLGAHPRGDSVAVVREGVLWLVDTRTRAEQELTRLRPSGRKGDDVWVPAPTADFSADGRLLLFLREEAGRVVAVVRELATGRERRLDTGPGEPRRARFDPSGEWLVVYALSEDTDGNGVLSWPQERTSLAPPLCRGPVTSSSHFGFTGDRPSRRFVRADGQGPWVDGADVLQPQPKLRLSESRFEAPPQGPVEWVPAVGPALVEP